MFPTLKLMNTKETLGPVPLSPVLRFWVQFRVQMLGLEGVSLHDTEPGGMEAVFSPEGVRADQLLEGAPQWGTVSKVPPGRVGPVTQWECGRRSRRARRLMPAS